MDSFSSDFSDMQVPGLSLSLVSYGSDLETSVDDPTTNLQSKTVNSISDADTVCEEEPSTSEDTFFDPVCKHFKQLSCSGLSNQIKAELEKAISDAASAKKRYLETLEVYRAVQSVLSSDKLPQPTKEKAQKVLLKEELKGYVGTQEGTGLLGLKEEQLEGDCPELLSENDKKLVRLAVESHLILKAKELKQLQSSKQEILTKLSTGTTGNSHVRAEAEHTLKMSSLRADLTKELDRYYKTLASLDSLLESIVQLKTNKISETCLKIIDSFEAKAQLLTQKAKLINAEIQNAIYTEDTVIVAAMQLLEEDLDLLLAEIESDLAKTNGLLAAYDRVKCREYDAILLDYVNLMKQVKSAKYVLEEVKGACHT